MIINPRALRFESPSHGSDPLVAPTTYRVELLPDGQGEPAVTVDLAASLATPVDGAAPPQYDLPFSAIPYPADVTFAAQLRAKNAAGESAPSALSGPFRAESGGDLEGSARLTFGSATYVIRFTYQQESTS